MKSVATPVATSIEAESTPDRPRKRQHRRPVGRLPVHGASMLTRVLRTVPLDRIDNRSHAGVYLRRLRDDLRQQLGREPSASEARLIDRVCVSALVIEALEQHIVVQDSVVGDAGVIPAVLQRDTLLVTMTRLLRQLGFKGRPKSEPHTLSDYLASKSRAG